MFVTGQSAVASNAKFANANIWMPTPTVDKGIFVHRDNV